MRSDAEFEDRFRLLKPRQLRLTVSMERRLAARAKKEGCTVSELMRRAIAWYLLASEK